jgi:hypothetical protein
LLTFGVPTSNAPSWPTTDGEHLSDQARRPISA